MTECEQRPKAGRFIKKVLVLLSFYVCFIALVFLIDEGIFLLLGRPSGAAFYATLGLTGLLLFAVIWGIFAFAHRDRFDKKGRRDSYQRITAALDEISQGNFDVLLSTEGNDFHQGLAQSINSMAKSLGSLETMRQDFISNVSHEIQSPLTSIAGFASLLQKEDLTFEQRQHYAQIIEVESKRISKLSDNLLRLSALESEKEVLAVEEFRLDKQLNDIALALEPQWQQKDLLVEAELDDFIYAGDKNLLSQVWMNLIHNAIKFTPEGGAVSLSLLIAEEAAIVSIKDTGIGIDHADQVHIFERFYKVDVARDCAAGGNGLGLSLVKKIVELHEGHVEVVSELGEGTVFKVFLPLSKASL